MDRRPFFSLLLRNLCERGVPGAKEAKREKDVINAVLSLVRKLDDKNKKYVENFCMTHVSFVHVRRNLWRPRESFIFRDFDDSVEDTLEALGDHEIMCRFSLQKSVIQVGWWCLDCRVTFIDGESCPHTKI